MYRYMQVILATAAKRPQGMVSTFRLMSPVDLASPTAVRYGRAVLLETAGTVNRSYELGPVNETGSSGGGGVRWLGPMLSRDSAQIWIEGQDAPGHVHGGDCVLLRTQEGYVNTADRRVSIAGPSTEDETGCLHLRIERRPALASFTLDADIVQQAEGRDGRDARAHTTGFPLEGLGARRAAQVAHYGSRLRLLSCDGSKAGGSLCGVRSSGAPAFLQVRPTPTWGALSVSVTSASDCEVCREFELDSTMTSLAEHAGDPLGAARYGDSLMLRTMVPAGEDLQYISASESGALVTSNPSSDHTVATLVRVSGDGEGDMVSVGRVRDGDVVLLRYEKGFLAPSPQVPPWRLRASSDRLSLRPTARAVNPQ